MAFVGSDSRIARLIGRVNVNKKTLGRMNNLQYLKFLITIPCPIHKIDLAYRCTLSDLQFVDPSAGEELNHSMEYSNELLPTTCRIGSVKASG